MFSQATLTLLYWAIGALAAALVLVLALKAVGLWPGSKAAQRDLTAPEKTITAAPIAPAATSSRSRSESVSWAGRRLFAHEERQAENGVPRIEPGDIPAVDSREYAVGPLTPALAALLPESEERRQQWKRDLRTAGYLSPRAWQNFAAVRYLCVIAPMLVLGVALVLVPRQLEMPVAITLIIVPLLGWALPALRVRSQAADRKNEIERGMPDLVDMLNMCVSQGLTLTTSLRRIRRQLAEPYPALATEVGIVIEQAEVGSLEQALRNFAERIEVPEVHSLTNLLTQTDRMGTSVSESLKTHSDGVRESLRQRADEKANRASFRLLFPTVLCLMPAVYLVLLGPAVIELNKFFGEEGGRSLIEASRNAVQQVDRAERAE
jgi:tight adherence protein C